MAVNFDHPQHYHGTDAAKIRELAMERPEWAGMLHPRLPYLRAEIVWAAREELCMTVEDALSRRTRSLLLDAKAAIECAATVAELLAAELGRDREWQKQQVEEFKELAAGYLAPVRITT
jgi:glycerol-3-phosphate dehydrogenase